MCSVPGGDTAAASVMLGDDGREAFDAGAILVRRNRGKSPPFSVDTHLLTQLPFTIEGFPPPPPTQAVDTSERFQYPIYIRDEYLYQDLLATDSEWYMVGLEGSARDTSGRDVNKMWFTKSRDNGKTWKRRQMLSVGNLPVISQT